MRPLLAVLVPALLAAASAAASERLPPSCKAYIPTGQALPRQDVARNPSVLMPSGPTRRGQKPAKIWQGDTVTVTRECGSAVRVRLADGAEGWVPIAVLTNEYHLAQLAADRPIETERDCELRYLDSYGRKNCLAALVTRQVLAAEKAGSRNLAGDELKTFLTGRTIEAWERGKDKTRVEVEHHYFAPDGEYFLATQGGSHQTLWRGRYVIDGENICFPRAYMPCVRTRRLDDGRTIWVTNTGGEADTSVSDGDTFGTVAEASMRFPKQSRPPVPAELAGADGPVMGR